MTTSRPDLRVVKEMGIRIRTKMFKIYSREPEGRELQKVGITIKAALSQYLVRGVKKELFRSFLSYYLAKATTLHGFHIEWILV